MTDEKCKQNDNVLTSVIIQDINDTQREIDQFQNELDALMGDTQSNKLAIYMREGKISKRKEFVIDLNSILEYRRDIDTNYL